MPESDLDANAICRACAGPFLDKHVNLMEDSEILDIFRTFSTTQVDPSDTLPKSICSKCNIRLLEYKRFQNVCVASYKFLLDCFPPKYPDKKKSLRTRKPKRKSVYEECSTSDTPDSESDYEYHPSKNRKVSGKRIPKQEKFEKIAEVDIVDTLNSDDDALLAEIVRKCKEEAEEERKIKEEKANYLRLWVSNGTDNSNEPTISNSIPILKREPEDTEDESKVHKQDSLKNKHGSLEVKPDPDNIKQHSEEIKQETPDIKQDSVEIKEDVEEITENSKRIKKDCSEIKINDSDDSCADFSSDDDDKDYDVSKDGPDIDDSDEEGSEKRKENAKKMKARSRILRIDTFQCDKCPKVFLMKERFEGHMRAHAGLKAFECDLCDKKYARYERLKIHKKYEHSGDQLERFYCSVEGCDKTFKNRETLKKHVKAHTVPPKPYIRVKPRKQQLFICELCGKQLTSKASMVEHDLMHKGETPFACDKCPKSFRTQRKLKIHKMRHDGIKKFTCEICGLKKICKKELRAHISNVHTREKKFTCKICDAKFLTQGNLSRHEMKTHGDIKTLSCSVCDRKFAKEVTLQTHMRKKHATKRKTASSGNTGHGEQEANSDGKYSCPLCDKVFKLAQSLQTHRMMHTGERPYSCEQCGKGFVARPSMLRHMRRHKAKEEAKQEANQDQICVVDDSNTEERVMESNRIAYDTQERMMASNRLAWETEERIMASNRIAFDILNNLY